MIKWIGDRGHPMSREQWSITVSARCRFSGQLNTGAAVSSRLRRAWAYLRFRHPSVAATANDDTLNYHVPDSAALSQWNGDTFHIISDSSITAGDLVANLNPSPYVTGYFLPHEQRVVLHTAHWRTDGFGALQLLSAFLEAITSIDTTAISWGEESVRLSPGIEEVLGIPTEPTEEIKAAAAQCLATVGYVAGSVGLPYHGDSTTQPEGTRSVRRTIFASTARDVLKACEEQGLRLLSAIHASLAKVNFRFAGARDVGSVSNGHYASTMRFSLRPYLRAPFNTAQYASALYTGGYLTSVGPGSSWQGMAAQYEALYESGLDRAFLLARRQYAIEALATMKRNAGAASLRSEIDISSVDDAEKLVAPVYRGSQEQDGTAAELEVEDIGLGVECLTRETYLFHWTFKGNIEFQLVYNSGFYNAEFIEVLLEALIDTLVDRLYLRRNDT